MTRLGGQREAAAAGSSTADGRAAWESTKRREWRLRGIDGNLYLQVLIKLVNNCNSHKSPQISLYACYWLMDRHSMVFSFTSATSTIFSLMVYVVVVLESQTTTTETMEHTTTIDSTRSWCDLALTARKSRQPSVVGRLIHHVYWNIDLNFTRV